METHSTTSRPPPPAQRPITGQGFFQCSACKQVYTRGDHLVRHIRSHTQDKPFQCTVCLKRFARTDLLRRHAARHDDQGRQIKRQIQKLLPGSGRVSHACKACASAKLKCEEEKPCPRCKKKGIECEIEPQRTTRDAGNSGPSQEEREEGEKDIQQTIASRSEEAFGGSMASTQMPAVQTADGLHCFDRHPLLGQTPADPIGDISGCLGGSAGGLYFGDLDLYNGLFGGCGSGETGVGGGSGIPLDEGEFGPKKAVKDNSSRQLTLGIEAFRRSGWSWAPGISDQHLQADQHQHSFSLPAGTDKRIEPRWRTVTGGRISTNARDKLLGLVLRAQNSPHGLVGFPSEELLGDLVDSWFHSQLANLDLWIHPGTFQASAVMTDKLAGLVAAGAVLTPIAALRRLGFALQEVIRLSVPMKWESNNACTRNLQLLQAFALNLEIGIWSGGGRKTEGAEGYRQPVVTMLRRTGKLRRSYYTTIAPKPEDHGEVLEQKWHRWVEQESSKRLVYHFFILDAQSSMLFQTNPLFSYSELSLGLPESRVLWLAPSAEEWKRIHLAEYGGPDHQSEQQQQQEQPRAPSLIECLSSFPAPVIKGQQRHQAIDADLATHVTLHGVWHLIREFRQRNGGHHHQQLLQLPSNQMALLRQGLQQSLLEFRLLLCPPPPPPSSSPRPGQEQGRPDNRLVLQLLSMSLYASVDSLQTFAGKEGEEEGRHVVPALRQWFESRESRQAVWHAGQVLREARIFPRNRLRDFYAVAVYHAALALWAYGVLAQSKPPQPPPPPPPSPSPPAAAPFVRATAPAMVILDSGEEDEAGVSTATEQFIDRGYGTPGIQGGVPLHDPMGVMAAIIDILRKNNAADPSSRNGGEEFSLPPLVGNLMQLMADLGDAGA